MKVIITESQYKKILLEQSNVYDDDISYQKALKIYNEIWKTYNDSVKYYNFIKNSIKPIIAFEISTFKFFDRFFIIAYFSFFI